MSTSTPASNHVNGPGGRERRIRQEAGKWVDQLTDLGPNNKLLYYRDLKVGTLNLREANDAQLHQLLAGHPVRSTQLLPDPAQQRDAARRLQTIYKKIRALDEQYGISTGYLAAGIRGSRGEFELALRAAPCCRNSRGTSA